jgi:hypothetical protein
MLVKNNRCFRMMKNHFINNPEKCYSIKYFANKYGISYGQAKKWLNALARQGFLIKGYFSANQGLFAWGVPHPIFSVFLLNKQLANHN